MASSDETSLIQRILTRDPQALSELYHRYSTPVYSLALRIVHDERRAEDATMDVFLKLWFSAGQTALQSGNLLHWLLLTTRSAALAELHQGAQAATVTLDDALRWMGSKDLRNEFYWRESRRLGNLLLQLPAEQLQVIELACFQGMTHSQIAARLGVSTSVVKERLSRGMYRLKLLWHDGMKEQHVS